MALQLAWQCFVCLLPFNQKEQPLSVAKPIKPFLSAYDQLKQKADREASEVLYWLEDAPLFEAAEKARFVRRFVV